MPTRYTTSMGPKTAAAVLAIAACGLGATASGAAAAKKRVPALPAFTSCKALLSYAHAGSLRAGGTEGVVMRAGREPLTVTTPARDFGRPTGGPEPTVLPAPQAAEAGTATATAGKAAADPTFSTTNQQEQGVDEPDVVKTDGDHVYAVTDATLRVIDVTGAAPKVVGTLKLEGFGHELLLRGKRLLVMASGGYGGGGPIPVQSTTAGPRQVASSKIAVRPGFGSTLLTEVDISTPAEPKVARAMTVDGDFVDARLTGGTARLVVGSAPDPIVAQDGQTLRQAVARTGTGRYIPRTVLRSSISGRTFKRPLAQCRQVRRPRSFSGTGLLTIMTVDLDRGLYSVDRDAVMAGAQVVYGSTGSLYVASRRYAPAIEDGRSLPSAGVTTEIHRFDAATDGATTYRSTGVVDGFVLNQYALSEHEGRLRVATTSEPLWFEGREAVASESAVTVLGPDAADPARLRQIGRVGDLGKGERIYAVRFVGDAGYVVTFRQVDPLYVVDLSNAAAPKVRGELKITGYSAYLHPVADGLLLGVGQEATPEGRRQGSQVSLFDVSEPENPRRLSQRLLGNGSSAVEFDPHAFLYWAPTKLAVLPLEDYSSGATPFTGAVGLTVDRAAGITEAGRTQHAGQAPIVRSLVAQGKLFTLSYAGLGRSSLTSLADEAFVPFS